MITRPLIEADESFVYDSWLRSFRLSNESGPYPPDVYFPAMREAIKRLLARPGVRVLVLVDDAIDVIIGYVVHEPAWCRWSKRNRRLEAYHLVHYVFVREGEPDARVRGRGYARCLLDAAGVRRDTPSTAFSFSTSASRGLMGQACRFLPDAARYETRQELSQ